MDNIKEVFGFIDGYELKTVGSHKVKKEKLFDDIKKKDKDIIDECKKALEKSGRIYTYEKDKLIKAIYVFEEDKKKEKILRNTKTIYCKEINDELKEKFDNRLKTSFEEELLQLEYDKIYLNDTVIQIDPKKSKKEVYAALAGGFFIGLVLGWIIFDDIAFGIIWGLLFGGAFSGLDVVVSKKRGRKNK